MKEYVAVIMIVLLLPYVATMLYQGRASVKETTVFQREEDETQEGEETEEALVGALAAVIPVSYPKEVLKAQAVLLRTQLARESSADKADSGTVKIYSIEEMKELWGSEEFSGYYARLKEAIDETAGQIITYEGEPAYVPYHAVSAGYTRDPADLFTEGEYPYLKSVDCSTDVEADSFLSISYYSAEEFKEKLTGAFDVTFEDAALLENIRIEEMDRAGYVMTVLLGTKEMSGEEFRQGMKFPSSSFIIEEFEGNIRVVTKGRGHGLGFDQYQAKRLAEEGKQMKEILNYFFSGIQIEG